MSQIIAGLYEIERKIGSGGGGIVYLGRHIRLEKRVVLKADRRKLSTDTEALRREVDLLKSLSHTYIPQVYDFVQEDGVVYTVMDYIEGESLDKLLGRGQIPSQPQVIRWACQLLEALCYLHGQPPYGILHGDIKPANIMLRPNGDICLIDFNIALALGEEGAVNVGYSRGYASPEHYGVEQENTESEETVKKSLDGTLKSADDVDADETLEHNCWVQGQSSSGNHSGKNRNKSAVLYKKSTRKRKGILLDVRSDIYSLGATLYHLLSGTRPAQDAKDVAALTAEVCSPAISVILQKAMAPAPEERYQRVEEMLEAFRQLHLKDPRPVRHRRRIAASAGILSTAFFLGGVAAFVGQRQLGQIQEARAMAEYSANMLAEGDVSGAIRLALQVIPSGDSILEAPVTAEAQKALTDALGVYDLSDGFKAAYTIELPGAPFDLSISPEGTRLAVVYGYEAAVYDLETQSKIVTLEIQNSALSDCIFTDEDHVAYAGKDGVALYDLSGQKNVWTGEAATTLAVSSDGSTVAAVDRDAGHAVVYNAVDGTRKADCSFEGLHMAVAGNDIFADPQNYVFALNKTGNYLAVSFYNGGLTIFDLQDSEGDLVIYNESEYSCYKGGFCGKYFAFTARKNDSLFGLIDVEEGVWAGSLESQDDLILEANEDGIYLGRGNVLIGLDLTNLTEMEIAYTGSFDITNFDAEKLYTLVATENNGFSFYDSGAHLITTGTGNQNADFVCLKEKYAVIGNRTEHDLRILQLDDHAEAQLASYDARYSHTEARLSADKETIMLFGNEDGTFRIYSMDGQFIAEGNLPDEKNIYDYQFRREENESYLEVIWYDGMIRCYSSEDGALLSEEMGEVPSRDLYEEFFAGNYRIASSLHEAPIVYDVNSGEKLATLEVDGYLTYVEKTGDYFITEYLDADGMRYGLLLNRRFETLARLPGLCDVMDNMVFFDYGSGNLRQSRLFSLRELIDLGAAYTGKK